MDFSVVFRVDLRIGEAESVAIGSDRFFGV